MTGYIIAALATLIAALITYRATRRAARDSAAAQAVIERHKAEVLADRNAIDRLRADGEAYDRAQRINAGLVGELRDEIDRLRTELTETRAELADTRRSNAALERRARNLIDLLEHNRIPVPEGG